MEVVGKMVRKSPFLVSQGLTAGRHGSVVTVNIGSNVGGVNITPYVDSDNLIRGDLPSNPWETKIIFGHLLTTSISAPCMFEDRVNYVSPR